MTYERTIGPTALAFALLCGACSSSSSSGEGNGGKGGKGGKGGSSASGGQSSGGQTSASSSKGGSGGQSSTSGSGGGGGSGGGSVGQGGRTGSSQGGASGSTGAGCPNATSVTACGGDVVGSWSVTSGCLNLSGDFETFGTGLGCDKAKVTGSVQVKGSFVATADKKYQDKTTTTGSATVTLDHQCLWMSGTWTQCDLISVAIEGLGFKNVKCVDATDGGCTCPAEIEQTGNMALLSADPQTSGDYSMADNALVVGQNPLTGTDLAYSYCVANGKLSVTPKTASPPMTGTIVLQKAAGTGGAGGNAGGAGGAGGITGAGGTTGAGGVTGAGGTTSSSGGAGGKGGATASGGATGGTSAGGSGGSTSTKPNAPCDILAAANTPCVAAYGVVRAIYKDYKGPLYQVRSKADANSLKDVPVLEAGGYADSKVQDDFCATSGCTVSKIYDQSPKGNDLVLTPNVCWLSTNGQYGPKCNASSGAVQREADVKNNPKLNVGGHSVYGLKTMGSAANANCYRVIKGNGTATGDQPEFIYAVFDTTFYSQYCCYDFGNAETTGQPDSFTSMEAIAFGNTTMWGQGAGNGPWFSCDYEAIISGSNKKVDSSVPAITSSIIKKYGTFMLKGFSGDHIALKYADAEGGSLVTQWDGARVRDGANIGTPMHKQGSIILGSGGDGSFLGKGVFFEGAMTASVSEDKAVDEAIQANIVAAGYNK